MITRAIVLEGEYLLHWYGGREAQLDGVITKHYCKRTSLITPMNDAKTMRPDEQ